MKNVMKVGALALALGLFVTACNSGSTSNSAADSSALEMSAPSDNQAAPMDTMAPMDTTAAPVDTSSN